MNATGGVSVPSLQDKVKGDEQGRNKGVGKSLNGSVEDTMKKIDNRNEEGGRVGIASGADNGQKMTKNRDAEKNSSEGGNAEGAAVVNLPSPKKDFMWLNWSVWD